MAPSLTAKMLVLAAALAPFLTAISSWIPYFTVRRIPKPASDSHEAALGRSLSFKLLDECSRKGNLRWVEPAFSVIPHGFYLVQRHITCCEVAAARVREIRIVKCAHSENNSAQIDPFKAPAIKVHAREKKTAIAWCKGSVLVGACGIELCRANFAVIKSIKTIATIWYLGGEASIRKNCTSQIAVFKTT